MRLRIVRIEESDQGTFGVMLVNGAAFCVTLEPPDRGNKRDVSCIPAGHYHCHRVQSPKYGATFEIVHVPNRSHILFHAGNVVTHTHGCILLGQHFGKLQGDRAVLNSGNTFRQFMGRAGSAVTLELEIVDLNYYYWVLNKIIDAHEMSTVDWDAAMREAKKLIEKSGR